MANPNLTEREQQVANLIASGLTHTQVAGELHISPHTVRSHLVNIHDKLNTRNSIQMANTIGKLEFGELA